MTVGRARTRREVAAEAAEPTTATGGEKEEEEDPRENRPIRTDLGY